MRTPASALWPQRLTLCAKPLTEMVSWLSARGCLKPGKQVAVQGYCLMSHPGSCEAALAGPPGLNLLLQ